MDTSLRRENFTYIDILRTAAAYSVIALHCVSTFISRGELFGTRTWWACSFINSTARMGVPMFFMISGFLLLRNPRTLDIKSFYSRRLRRLALPFLTWDIIYFLLDAVQEGQSPSPALFLRELFVQGSKYHLWFVYQILGLYLLAPFLKRLLDACKPKEQWLFLLLATLPTTVFPFINLTLPVYLAPFGPLVDGYAGFFIAGYLLGSHDFPKKYRFLYCLAIPTGIAISMAGNFFLSSPENMSLPFNTGYVLTHYLTASGIFLLAKDRQFAPRFSNLCHRLAQASFGIYMSHVLVLDLFRALLPAAGVQLTPAWFIAASFIFTTAVSSLLSVLAGKCPTLKKFLL